MAALLNSRAKRSNQESSRKGGHVLGECSESSVVMRSFVLAGRSLFCVLCSRFEERILELGFECRFTDLTGDVSLASPLDRITLDRGVRLTLRVVFIRTLACVHCRGQASRGA